MFDTLSEKLQAVFRRLSGKGRLTEADVLEAAREVRLALLEADVNLAVVKEFVARVKQRAVGADVLESLSPAQQVVKIVNEEMIAILGDAQAPLRTAADVPTVLMLCGLQGTGKTTLCSKLAVWLGKQGRSALMVACDTARPAAITQLQVLGAQVGVPVFAPQDPGQAPPAIARAAVQHAQQNGMDTVILDTAGRLHIDEPLMDELARIESAVRPTETLLVVDAMVGQDAVNFAQEFCTRLEITGFVMTKLDGDTRGGAALSIRFVTGIPIKFLSVGERPDALEPFYPDRLASRILGMGDILSLVEKAQAAVDARSAAELERKLRESRFDLNDFLDQLQHIRKMGPLENVMKLLPGMNAAMMENVQLDPAMLARKEAIVRSMTPQERAVPAVLNGSRRRRIAVGAGQSVQDVNRFLSEFDQMRKVIHEMVTTKSGGKLGAVRSLARLNKFPGSGRQARRLPRMPFHR